jgi:hypothetical protein
MEKPNKGPFIIKDGKVSDAEVWASEMPEPAEEKFDKYMKIKAVNKATRIELAQRKADNMHESLMEGFKKYE